MSKTSAKLTGPMRLHALIAEAALPVSEKAVLYGCLRWVGWRPGQSPEIRASVSSIAHAAGLTRDGARKVLDRLRDMGVVEDLGDRKGGRAESGKGRASPIRLSDKRLEELASTANDIRT